uniref:T9SS type A sorting domain-containing protein n=1 Tax=candidate division WOR-3 bacterium TaxID=2052148 RepID=A0A7C4XTR1_UNCW3
MLKIKKYLLFVLFWIVFGRTGTVMFSKRPNDLVSALLMAKGLLPSTASKDEAIVKEQDARTFYLDSIPYWTSQTYNRSIWGVGLADITGDGYPEVITVYEGWYNYLYLNNSGVIEDTPSWQSNDMGFHISPAFGDLDNDGDLDMAVATYYLPGGRSKVYRNDNGILTRDPVWIASSGGGTSGEWCDFDNDGDLDWSIVDIFASPMIFRNNNGILENSPCWTGIDGYLDFGCAWLDIDNDGDLDFAVGAINEQYPLVRVYYNRNGALETEASWRSQVMAGDLIAIGLAVADANKDGWLDLGVSCGFVDTNYNVVFMNLHDSLESNPSWISNDASVSGFSIFGDLNNDSYLDWAVNNGDVGSCYENINGNLNPSYTWHSATVTGGLGIDLGDVDQDGVVYREDTIIADGTKKLFYLSIIPVQKIERITINGDSVPLTGYCCNLKSGWVSFRDSIPAGSQLIFKYYYSLDMDLLLSDYYNGEAHLFKNNVGVGIFERASKPMAISLLVYPNPFTEKIEIRPRFQEEQLTVNGKRSTVSLKIYDATGRLVKRFNHLTNYKLSIMWDGTDDFGRKLPTGVYLVQLDTGVFKQTEKVILLR